MKIVPIQIMGKYCIRKKMCFIENSTQIKCYKNRYFGAKKGKFKIEKKNRNNYKRYKKDVSKD
jgi:hypothetical protein